MVIVKILYVATKITESLGGRDKMYYYIIIVLYPLVQYTICGSTNLNVTKELY